MIVPKEIKRNKKVFQKFQIKAKASTVASKKLDKIMPKII